MNRYLPFQMILSTLLAACAATSGAVGSSDVKEKQLTALPNARSNQGGTRAILKISRSREAGARRSCLVGSHFDPERPRSIATVMLWDEAASRSLWIRDISLRADFQQARAIDCSPWNGGYAVLVESDTQAAASLSQTFSSVYWLGADGSVRGHLNFDQGRQTWGHALQANGATLRVIGATEASDGRLSNTIVEVDSKLVASGRLATRNGAFLQGAATAIEDQGLMIAGNFLDDAATIRGTPRTAASRINPQTGKYLWSYTLPDDDEVRDAIAAIDPGSGTAILTRTPDALGVQWLDRNGHAGVEARFPNRVCNFKDAVQHDGSIYVVGTACDEGGRLYLLRVPRAAAGSPVVLKDFDPQGSLLLQASGQWQYVNGDAGEPVVEHGRLN